VCSCNLPSLPYLQVLYYLFLSVLLLLLPS
jgi:hypothetical protein